MRWLRIPIVLLVLIGSSPGPASAAGPAVTVLVPEEGASIEGDTVTVTFTTTDITLVPTPVSVAEAGKHPEANRPGEGHLHLVLDLQPLVVWERGEPYTFTDVPLGAHLLMVELVNNDHSSLSPPVMRQIRFGSAEMRMLPRTGTASYNDVGSLLLVLGVLLLAAGGLILRHR